MIRYAIIILSIFTSVASQANVDLATGRYMKTSVDLKVENFRLIRTYNSQQMATGLFGYGWCSTLDYEVNTKKTKLDFCGKYLNNKVSSKNNTYSVDLNENKFTFDQNGRLNKICHSKVKQCVYLTYISNKILIKGSRSTIHITKAQGKIKSLKLNKKLISTYQYNNKFLVGIQNFIKKTKNQFSYNEAQHLQKIFNQRGHYVKINYNKNKIVESIFDHRYCGEEYRYRKLNALKIKVTASRKCGPYYINQKKYEITYNNDYKVQTIKNNDRSLTTYVPGSTQITQFQDIDLNKKIIYNKNGSIKEIKFQNKKPFSSAKLIFQGQLIKKIEYKQHTENHHVDFNYNKNGALKKAIHSKKGNIYFTYKKNGLLKKINGPHGKLSYKYNSNILNQVTLSKENKVFRHKLNKSKDQTSAIKIAKYLNSIYEFIGPAYSDVAELKRIF